MAEAEQRQVQIRIDESRMNTTYANTIRTTSTLDEVILDFGLNLPVQSQGGQPTMVFAVGSRVVVNWAGAKRLSQSLNQLIASYEKARGEININPQG
jgi:hypothetical protein